MFRPRRLPISLQPCSQSSLAPARTTTRLTPPSRRYLSNSPPFIKKRTWKGTFFRWGLAGGAVYWYNTSPLFAEDPARYSLDPKADHDQSSSDTEEESSGHTLESLAAAKAKKLKEHGSSILGSITGAGDDKKSSPKPSPTKDGSSSSSSPSDSKPSPPSPNDPAALSEEAGQEGAFNPETGEINWDCPCLGGMAHGPCGEEFRAAFSCFVYSEEEPKGMDCIEKFQGMQDCFRAHPDIYADELMGDDDDDEGLDDADSDSKGPGEAGEGKDALTAEEKERKRELVKEIREKRRENAERESATRKESKTPDQKSGGKSGGKSGEKRLLESDAPVERKKLILKAHERESMGKGKS